MDVAPERGMDQNGNPVFNSIQIYEQSNEEYDLVAGYYTIGGNIANPESSVFVSIDPTIAEIMDFATGRPSYFFVVHKRRITKALLSLNPINGGRGYNYTLVDAETGTAERAPSKLRGSLTEHRYKELTGALTGPEKDTIEFKADEAVGVPVNGVYYLVLPFEDVLNEVTGIIEERMLIQ
ncbi:MAG: hypothetical protein OEV42_03660 [Deltaproteobacteria bacterium]|nr:hypothetical protein [Deltaproteobacteria bacterium]